VALKLDIDNADVELPIVADILNRPAIAELIDEFFFEFHFRCEYMMQYWGRNLTGDPYGFKRERPDVLKVFQKLRYLGIRAHIWV